VSWISPRQFFRGTHNLMDWEGCAPCSRMRSYWRGSCLCQSTPAGQFSFAPLWPSPLGCRSSGTLPLPLVRLALGRIEASWLSRPCSTLCVEEVLHVVTALDEMIVDLSCPRSFDLMALSLNVVIDLVKFSDEGIMFLLLLREVSLVGEDVRPTLALVFFFLVRGFLVPPDIFISWRCGHKMSASLCLSDDGDGRAGRGWMLADGR
jgi:hypothetical protein